MRITALLRGASNQANLITDWLFNSRLPQLPIIASLFAIVLYELVIVSQL